jgi:hypothetical protein
MNNTRSLSSPRPYQADPTHWPKRPERPIMLGNARRDPRAVTAPGAWGRGGGMAAAGGSGGKAWQGLEGGHR